jgi:hypothetical protein
MKNKLQFSGLLSLALLTFSCSNDDYEIQVAKKNSNLKDISNSSLKKELNEITLDLDIINTYSDGEPNNPKPPRR